MQQSPPEDPAGRSSAHPDAGPSDTSRSAVTSASPQATPWVLLLGGVGGFIAAWVLTLETMVLLADPSYVPSCSINPVLSCGPVMASPQAEVFGFPNALMGIAGFAVVTASGAALVAGAHLPRGYWLGLQLGTTLGAGFVHWLIFQSLYRIGALCPYCMVVWAVTIPVFWYVTLHNLTTATLPVTGRWPGAVNMLLRYHSVWPVAWGIGVVILITRRFWFYWTSVAAGA